MFHSSISNTHEKIHNTKKVLWILDSYNLKLFLKNGRFMVVLEIYTLLFYIPVEYPTFYYVCAFLKEFKCHFILHKLWLKTDNSYTCKELKTFKLRDRILES